MSKADLHIHTIYSDGTDTPEELIKKLQEASIETFAVTDHDTIKGLDAFSALVPEGMRMIPGVEISCRAEFGEVHILGYNCDFENEEIKAVLANAEKSRKEWLKACIAFLKNEFDISLDEDALNRLEGVNCVGKVHVGAELVKLGLCENVKDAVMKYIDFCPVKDVSTDAAVAVSAIRAASGMAIWAHPLGGETDKKLTTDEFLERFWVLRRFGIHGLECFYSRYDAEDINYLKSLCGIHSIFISGGSDYHGENKDIALGQLNRMGNEVEDEELTILERI